MPHNFTSSSHSPAFLLYFSSLPRVWSIYSCLAVSGIGQNGKLGKKIYESPATRCAPSFPGATPKCGSNVPRSLQRGSLCRLQARGTRVRLSRDRSIGRDRIGAEGEISAGKLPEEEVVGQSIHPSHHKLLHNSHFPAQFCHIS